MLEQIQMTEKYKGWIDEVSHTAIASINHLSRL